MSIRAANTRGIARDATTVAENNCAVNVLGWPPALCVDRTAKVGTAGNRWTDSVTFGEATTSNEISRDRGSENLHP